MDYAFVPGHSPYEDLLKRAMASRDRTELVNKAGIATIAGFFQSLEDDNIVADNLILGAHASDESFAINFDSTTATPPLSNGKDFEMLQALDKTGTVHIPANIKTALTHCHVKGCNAGADTAHPFLALFMKVLGGTQTVTAPKYLHDLKDDAGNGVLEYMVAEYTVMSPTAFKTTDALVKEFRNRNFTQGVEKNGTPEPVPDKWKNWISTSLKLDPALSDEKPFDITTKVVPAAGGLKLINRNNGKATSRFEGGFPVHKDMTGITVPPDTAGRMAFLKDAMKTDPREKDGHPFPLHVRFGFSTIDEWMTGFDWVPTFDGRVLTFTGGHFVYTVRLPIVKVGTNQLIYNYYPKGGNATMNFREDNDKFKLFGSA